MVRLDDRRQVICLCPLLHMLHVANRGNTDTMKIGGTVYPTIDNANALWIKKIFDPSYYDESFLEKTWKSRLPEPLPLDRYWLARLRDNIGMRV